MRDNPDVDTARPRLTRREAQALTRRRLLDAAADVFAELGFRAASLTDVADRAGYTIGAVYSNFAGKDELFHALMRERLRFVENAFASALGNPGNDPGGKPVSTDELIAAELDQMVSMEDATPPNWWRLLAEFRSYAAAVPEARAELIAAELACRDILACHIERFAQETGLIMSLSATEIAELSMAVTDGLRAAYAEGRSSIAAGEGLRLITEAFIRTSARTTPA
jgi:AcrR family transcriptional regulator